MAENEAQRCRHIAVGLLARREHSNLELRNKLRLRDYGESVIEPVLAELIDKGLLCNERFAECYVRSRVNRGIGPVRLKQELLERGVDAGLAESFLVDQDWQQLALVVRRKRFGEANPGNVKDRAKQSRFLQYRGFTVVHIRNVFKQDDWE